MFTNIVIEGFLSIGDPVTIPLMNQGLVLIEGKNLDAEKSDSNGAGKSTIFEAVLWCLFEEVLRSSSYLKDDVVNRNYASGCGVLLNFIKNGQNGHILRSRNHTSLGSGLQIVWDGSFKATEWKAKSEAEKVKEILGLDYSGFLYAFMFGQNTNKFLSESNDKEQKRFLEDLFFPDSSLRDLSAYFTILVTGCKTEAQSNEAKIPLIKQSILNTIDLMEKRKKELEDQEVLKQQRIQQIEARVTELSVGLTEQQTDLQKIKETGVAIRAQLDSVKSNRSVIQQRGNQLATDIDKLKRDKDVMSESIRKYNSGVSNAEYQIQQMNKQIEDLEKSYYQFKIGDRCLTCKSLITQDSVDSHLHELSTRIARIKLEKDPVSTGIKSILVKVQEMENQKSAVSQTILEAEAKIQSVRLEYSSFDKEIDALQTSLTKVETAFYQLESNFKTRNAEISTLQSEKERIQSAKPVQALTSYIEKIQSSEKELEVCESNIKKQKFKLEYAQFFQKMFGDQGLKSYLFDYITEPLNQRASYYSNVLTNGDLSIKFNTQKQLANGNFKDNFNIEVTSKSGSGNYALCCGGERKRANICIMKAVRDLVLQFTGNYLNISFFDEISNDLDRTGREMVFALMQEEVKERGTVFVITHDLEWKTRIDKVITVTKKNGLSEVSRNFD